MGDAKHRVRDRIPPACIVRFMSRLAMASPTISVLVSTHNPHRDRLSRALGAVLAQSLPASAWELVVVDNGSTPALDAASLGMIDRPNVRVIRENRLGLIYGRLAGIRASRADLLLFLDDDMVLAPDYLACAVDAFARDERLGNLAGQSVPEFETAPDAWVREFDTSLCIKIGRDEAVYADGWTGTYPEFSGGGGGAVFRRVALASFLRSVADHGGFALLPGRTGRELTSGEDNHLVLQVLRDGWRVAYSPSLVLQHLIPSWRLTPEYLGRLEHGIAKSWVQVLAMHGICPWTPAERWSIPFRKLRAYVRYRAWSGPRAYVRWRGACGQFEGRALIARAPRSSDA